jgi:uncharacterized protein involved in exopolysaccharide biosynthesis
MAGSASQAGAAALELLAGWLGDPAVLTALASLITALAALRRVRRGLPAEGEERAASLVAVHARIHAVEANLRAELVEQRDRLQAAFDRLQAELERHRSAAQRLEGAVLRCPQPRCPVRAGL